MDLSGFKLIESMFSSHSPEADEAVISFAGHFSSYAVNEETLTIFQNIYKNPEYGMKIYPFSIGDIYHTAKYLKVENEGIEQLIINFPDGLVSLSSVSTISRNIIDAHFDNSRKLENIIPSSILS